MTTQNKNVPALRFSGFIDEWENKSINELVNSKVIEKPLDGNHGGIHPKASDYVSSGIPFIMANDVYEGIVNLENSKKISKTQADKLQKGFSIAGDILLTHKGTVGETAIVPILTTDYIMLTPQVTYYRIKDKNQLNNIFLKCYFDSTYFQKDLQTFADSGTRPYIGITEQRSLKITFPTLPEQQKIGAFLTAVDEKIQQLTKKKDLLEQYKKGVMQKIFNQEIRFKDDNGNDFADWEEKKLNEVAEINPKCKKLPMVFIYIDLESVESGSLLKENEISLENAPSRAQRFLEKNDILYQTVRPYQKNNLFFDKDGIYVASTGYAQIRTKNNAMFLYQYLHTDSFVDEVLLRCTGTSYPAINSTDLSTIKINLPSISEQQKIANFLSAIDDKINLVNQQLEKTKEYKKGLLQQMFI